ncbi:MAG: ExeM/NucH family extracellular endonuclease, partial [Methylococcales bacterium]
VSPNIVISQVYGGGGNTGATYKNDFIELFNRGNSPVSLNGLSVQYASSTGSSWQVTNLTNLILQPGQYYLVQEAPGAGGTAALPSPEATGTIAMSGTAGKVALVSGTTALTGTCPSTNVIDLIGFGAANCSETSPTPALTSSTANLRIGNSCTDTDNNNNDFAGGAPTPRNSGHAFNVCGAAGANPTVNLSVSSATGSEAGATVITVTATAATAVSGNQSVNLAVSGVGISASDYSLGSAVITILNAATSGSTTFTVLDDNFAEGSETAILTINNPSIGISIGTATQSISIADNDVSKTPIYQIQGSGISSSLVGQVVTTRGVVTRVNNNGFYLQDAVGDNSAATSDGIFVFTNTVPTVSVGQLLDLSASVAEFNMGAAANADTLAHTVTELTSPAAITIVSSGNVITPTPVTLPELVNDDLEHYEGMLVTLTGPLTAAQNFFQGRYGQVTLSADSRLETPTNKFRPGTLQALALADENARRRILLDDGSPVQNPNPTPYIGLDNTLRAGDTVTSVTGVIDYGLATSDNTNFGDYKIHPTQTVTFTRANARTVVPDVVGGNIKVASFNVLNYFTTFTNGANAAGQTGQGCALDGVVAAANCRGAGSINEFNRQRAKIIAALQAIDADIVGLMEIQNNGNSAAQNLVDGLNAALGAGIYSVLPLPAQGTGTDAIRVAMIYKSAKVNLVGNSFSDADAVNNRPPLAQIFSAPNGQKFTVVVNHLKSKGSCPTNAADPDADHADGQGCWNSRRIQQARRLRNWIADNASADTLIIGDLNAYAQEDPIFELTSNGYVDQIGVFNSFGYSYVFDGAAGRLDHAITTASMSPKVAGAKPWKINADEPAVIDYNLEFKQPACTTCGPDYYSASPYRASDHDPVLIGLNMNDLDGDGLSDGNEVLLGTNTLDLDSDDDGISDGSEDANHNGVFDDGETNPSLADTDGDGLQDGTETGLSTGIADPDGTGSLLGTNTAVFLADADTASTTSATAADSDGDGFSDGAEDLNHNGKLDAGEADPSNPSSQPQAQTAIQVPAMPLWAMLSFGLALVLLQNKFRRHKPLVNANGF